MSIAVNVDGRITGEREATISVFDHGFLFGEGVYEVLRTYDGTPFLFAEHMARLRASAERIALPLPFDDDEFLARIRATMAAADLAGDAYIRVLVTRGAGDIVYDPSACPRPTTVVIVKPHAEPPASFYEHGVTISLVPVVRNHPDSVNPRIKSNNLLNNALAMQQAYRRQSQEALMRNHRGELCECAQSNFFLVTNGVLRTPPLEAGLLAGITRAFVLGLASSIGVLARQETLFEEDLASADEAFFTSSTKEIVPVVAVDALTIGDGRPGRVTKRLLAAFRERTRYVATGSGAA
jgi:branched-chain amino acid aminotransferase